MFLKVIPPDCRSARSSEEHSPQQQSEIEVEVLTATIGHGSSSPEGGLSRHRSGGNSTPHPYYTTRRSENPFTYPATSHPRTRGAPVGV
ncbi:hypothetical protein AVEN_200151-1 [Araneus ventricosus]|uniref:Uncharacterized protein n=1 Tax=Araneus ventricosus TaxID=182803 RepID=A0A4Y2NWD5_ARAVE|nr:hypothetical protein AVEN_200151-1 [Araneus ventricosus]